MAQQRETLSTIAGLIETLKDGEQGFNEAAESVNSPQLESLLRGYSQQRAQFASELQEEARRLGESHPEDSSSVSGAVHRAWINLKGAIASKEEYAILAECERGEDSAVKEYSKAMNGTLPAPVSDIVSRQCKDIKRAHDHMKGLRDALKKS